MRKPHRILTASVVFLVPSITFASILEGPEVNPANGNSYYLLSDADWTDSEAEAVALGGHLVTIRNASENSWVYTTFSQFGGINRFMWIGLNDEVSEGTFVWTSGEPVTYYNWAPGEPSYSYGGTERVVMMYPPGSNGQDSEWNDCRDMSV